MDNNHNNNITGRRFTVEELDNGWLVKITQAGSGQFVGRHAFRDLPELLSFLKNELENKNGRAR